MNTMTIFRNLTLIGAAACMLTACGTDHEKDTTREEPESAAVIRDTTPVTVSDTTKFKFDFAIANIPSPATTMQELGTWNVPYDNSILNSPRNAAAYVTEYQKGINLGIYNIDMAYAMVHEKGPDVLQYMRSILGLSDGLGLKGAVDMMIGKRAESNLSSKDSLFRILDEIFVKSDAYLRTNERVYTAATIFAGSWLESLYLTCRLQERATDEGVKETARKHLWEQRLHLENLISLLQDYKEKKDCQELIRALGPIHEELNAIRQPDAMTDKAFRSVSSKIYALRNQLTDSGAA